MPSQPRNTILFTIQQTLAQSLPNHHPKDLLMPSQPRNTILFTIQQTLAQSLSFNISNTCIYPVLSTFLSHKFAKPRISAFRPFDAAARPIQTQCSSVGARTCPATCSRRYCKWFYRGLLRYPIIRAKEMDRHIPPHECNVEDQ